MPAARNPRHSRALCPGACSKATFAFVLLLDVNQDPAFQCPICRLLRPSERCLLLDGITLGFRKQLRLSATQQLAVDTAEVVVDV